MVFCNCELTGLLLILWLYEHFPGVWFGIPLSVEKGKMWLMLFSANIVKENVIVAEI